MCKYLNFIKNIYRKFIFGIVLMTSFLFIFCPIETYAEAKVNIGKKAPNFVLEGADGTKYELKQMKGKTIILIMAPRKVEDDRNRWVKMLLKSFPPNDSLQIFTVFDMRGIPFFITDDFVRGKVKEKQEKHPATILMDWKQKVNKLLGANEDETDIFVFDAAGVLVCHEVGAYNDEKLILVKDKILKILQTENLKKEKTENKRK